MTSAEDELFEAIEKEGRVEFAGRGRTIGAEFLAGQLMREKGRRPRKLTLYDVAVAGTLDLEAAEIGFPVKFERCAFDQAPNFEQAIMAGLYFKDCRLPGLQASQMRVQDGMAIRGCHVNGSLRLTGAHIAGQLNMRDSVIVRQSGDAVRADGLRVEQDLFLTGCRVTGLTRMIGAYIGGQFICDGAVFRNPDAGHTLKLNGIVVREHVYWGDGFTVEGEADLSGADIAGRLICRGAHFFNLRGMALQATGMTVRQEAEFSEGCVVDGELGLVGCRIGGWLDFTGGEFRNPGRTAIDLNLASTTMNVVMRAGTVVHGKLVLSDAAIGGAFRAQGGHFRNRFDVAIEALGLKVDSDLSLGVRNGERFHAQGQVVLSDAHVGGNLNCTGGRFENAGREALVARGIRVDRNVLLRRSFTAHGRVDLAGSEIDGKVDFRDGWFFDDDVEAVRCDRVRVGHAVKFDGATVSGGVRMCDARIGTEVTFDGAALGGANALKLKGTQIRGTLRLNLAEPPDGSVDLRQVTTGSFDDREGDLPPGEDTRLDDFAYGALHDTSLEMSKRLKWLKGRPFLPQVYLQLAATYARAGHHDQATTVLVEKEEARRRAWKGFPGPLFRMCWWVLKPTVGYGYRPFRVLAWLALLQIAGGVVFRKVDTFAAARNGVKMEWYHSWLYTFDLLLPVVSLQHSDLWVPLGAARWWSLAFTVLGWALAICLVTGVGRLFKRDER
jgi:hypothetical protein